MKSALTIRVSDKVKKELAELAKDLGIPVSDLIRESLDHFIAVRKFRKLRGVILPFAETQGLLTDEDIFNKIS